LGGSAFTPSSTAAIWTRFRRAPDHQATEPEARRCLDYVARNRRRMRYPDFHRRGLCTSTGVLEAGCKVVVATRLKRAGMHWTLRGANAITALRCAKLSGRIVAFWQHRAA
jgi:hypothetical protein